MYIKIINPKTDGSTEYNNAGSCIPLVNYLSKEDEEKGLERELYFSHDRDRVTSLEVIRAIDNNCPKIEKNEAKFYSLVIAPRPEEMEHIKNDRAILKEYARNIMDIYAGGFNGKNGKSKNLRGGDLVYFAKLEENRYYKGNDAAVLEGKAKQGDPLPGNNTHIHIIVSRQDKTKQTKLSPLVNDKKLFCRKDFKAKSCKRFDNRFNYVGAGKELDRHRVMTEGSVEERIAFVNEEYNKRKAQLQSKEQAQTLKPELKNKQQKKNDTGLSL